MRYLLPLAVSFVSSSVLTWVVCRLALKAGVVDVPRQDGWHRHPVPKLGGVAMFVVFLGTFLAFSPTPPSRELWGLLVGAAVIFLIGLVDDFRKLENRPKLLLLIVTACVPALFGLRFGTFPPIVGVPLTIVWILGATNALNWLDNMDGLAAGVAAIAAGMLLVMAAPAGADSAPALLAATLLGVSLGFLVHNFPPARIFMGDAGSGFLGFTLAATATLGSSRDVSNVLLTVLIPGLILAVPIFDTLTVAWLRTRHGLSIFHWGSHHPSHRLVALGLSERRTVLLLYGLSALSGAVGLLSWRLGLLAGLAVSVLLALGFLALGIVLAEVRVYGKGEAPPGALRLSGPLMNKRWLVSMGLDLVLLCVAFVGAHLLRFEGEIPGRSVGAVAEALPIVLAAKMAVLYLFGVYRGAWRYVGVLDLVRLAQAASVGSLGAVAGLFVLTRLAGLSRAALVLDWILTLGLLASARVAIRALREYLAAHRELGRRVLIAGIGGESARLARALRETPELGYIPVGFVTHDSRMDRGTVIQGLPVLGDARDLAILLNRYRVETVILVPSELDGAGEEIRRVCEQAGIPVRQMGKLIE